MSRITRRRWINDLLEIERFTVVSKISALIYDTVDHHILSSEIIALSTTNVSSILSKMLVTLLLLGLTFSSVFEASATGCGCAMDRVISNNPDRIPSRIPELFCRQAGMSCGNTFSKVSN